MPIGYAGQPSSARPPQVRVRSISGWSLLFAGVVASAILVTTDFPRAGQIGVLMQAAFFGPLLLYSVLSLRGRKDSSPLRLESPVSPVLIVLGLIAALSLGSVFWSFDVAETIRTSAVFVGMLAILGSAAKSRWLDRRAFEKDIGPTVAIVFIALALGLAMDIAGLQDITRAGSGRYEGIFDNPNKAAALAGILIPIGIAKFFRTRSFFAALLSAVTIATLVLTETRSPWVGLILGLAIAGLGFGGSLSALKSLLVGMGLILSGLVYWIFGERILASAGNSESLGRFSAIGEDNLGSRTEIWGQTLAVAAESRLVGFGFGAGPSVLTYYGQIGLIAMDRGSAHSSILQMYLELGLIGLALLIALLAVLSFGAYKISRYEGGFSYGVSIASGIGIVFSEASLFGLGQAFAWLFWLIVVGSLSAVPLSRGAGGNTRGAF